jgi:hypothetical protein
MNEEIEWPATDMGMLIHCGIESLNAIFDRHLQFASIHGDKSNDDFLIIANSLSDLISQEAYYFFNEGRLLQLQDVIFKNPVLQSMVLECTNLMFLKAGVVGVNVSAAKKQIVDCISLNMVDPSDVKSSMVPDHICGSTFVSKEILDQLFTFSSYVLFCYIVTAFSDKTKIYQELVGIK